MMSLEQQVSPLAESRRLKELGVAQESMLRWFWNPHGHLPFISDRFDSPLTDGECCSAFSVAELGDLLPKGLAFHRVSKTWKCEYLYASPSGALRRRGECGETMAAAAGRLLIALIEAGAVKP